MLVEAIFENGVLRPTAPLNLREHERVTVEVLKSDSGAVEAQIDFECIESLRRRIQDATPVPSLEEVRGRLSKIPGSLTEDFIAERGER